MFRQVARLLAVAVLFGMGCEDVTFDLLPPPPKAAGTGGMAGETVGAAGETGAGMGGTHAGAGGSAAGRGGSGNLAGRGGTQNGGAGGSGPCPGPNCVP